MSTENLFTSIEDGDVAIVDRLLSTHPEAIEATNPEGLSPILVAAYWGQDEVLERLLRAAHSLSFWEAATVGATSRVAELIHDDPSLVTARSPDGFTGLHLAVFFGHPDTAQALIEAGADVRARTTNALANQPLHAAVAGGEPESRLACVQLLLQAGAPVNERQSGGFTPLMAAAQNGDGPVVDLLLTSGARPDLEDDQGLSAADHAAAAGHPDIAARLS
jgi:ankyrin repeat protein